MKVMLEYKIIFDPTETWQHRDMFESDLGKFFRERGLQAEMVDMADSNRPHVRMLLISEDETHLDPEPTKSPQQVKRQLTAKRDTEGKYEK